MLPCDSVTYLLIELKSKKILAIPNVNKDVKEVGLIHCKEKYEAVQPLWKRGGSSQISVHSQHTTQQLD